MVIINCETNEREIELYPTPNRIWHNKLFSLPSSVITPKWIERFGKYCSLISKPRGASVALVQLKREYRLYEQDKKKRPANGNLPS